MADQVRLSSPHIRVLMRDGADWEVQTENQDLVAWDMNRGPRKWPPMADAPFLWLTFLAWSAGKREGLHQLTWEQFRTDCVGCTALGAEGEDATDELGGTAVGPTQPEAVPD